MLVAGHVDDVGVDLPRQFHPRKAEVDRQAPALLLREPVGVDAGERAHERRLAVVDVARRADHDPLHGPHPAFTASAAGASSSGSIVETSSSSLPSDMRATTGAGAARRPAASASAPKARAVTATADP